MTASADPATTGTALDRASTISAPDDTGRLPVLWTSVALDRPRSQIRSAELVATAHGTYEARIDGAVVTTSVLNPGWTAYEWRLQYQTFEVTEQLKKASSSQAGEQTTLSFLLAGGWWRGNLGFEGANANYGSELGVLAALTITYQDGHVQEICTDSRWQSQLSAIESASLYNGQREDRRLELTEPRPARVVELDHSRLLPQVGPLITRHEVLTPEKIWTSPAGKTLVDFGQNLVGWIRFTATGPRGTTITLRHAEVLEDGELGTRPLRAAEATDRIVLAGDETGEFFEPTFTFHGFRYAEIEGWPGELRAEDLQAVVVHSDIPRTGTFECSEANVNQLVHNSIWGQKGNFLDVPTDCPQRDERLGWTGDIAAYAASAAFQFDVSDFLHKWLLDLVEETRHHPDQYVPFVVPDPLKYANFGEKHVDAADDWHGATAIWGDAAVWVPQALWQAYGDRERLGAHYPGMVLHLESVERALSPTGLWDTGFQFGDWLDPDASPHDPADAKADKGVVATACLYRSASFAAEAAAILGHRSDEQRWRGLADRTRTAFLEHYVSDDGRILSDCVTVYALAIHFGLLEHKQRHRAGQRLSELVQEAGYRVATGFAGTPFVTWALSETGHVTDAYRLLLETECPSWMYPVTMGATTIWERWDSMLPDGSINPGEMTSFNHYALGAVVDWIYQVILGIRPAEPGYARVQIQPVPGPGIDWARGSLETPHGPIEVDWSGGAEDFSLQVRVPEGVTAQVLLPDGASREMTGTGEMQQVR